LARAHLLLAIIAAELALALRAVEQGFLGQVGRLA
jgi:hypothetical protein